MLEEVSGSTQRKGKGKEVMSDKLTPKQNKFCQEYVIDYNGTRAAIRSGYSEMTAQEQSSRLLLNVIIQARIAELEEQTAKELSIEKADIYRMLLDTLYLARQERNLGVMTKCTELIGKMIGSFVDRSEVAVSLSKDLIESAERVLRSE
jgi:phage terminase small subunit